MDEAGELRAIGWACLALIGALMVVGVASHEILRHAIQSTPALAAAALALAKRPWARWAAAPVFLVWLLIPALIWLYLAHLSRIVGGTYSPVEIAMTLVMAAASAFGLWRIARRPGGLAWWAAAAVFVLFGAAQVCAMTLSFQPGFAHDGAA